MEAQETSPEQYLESDKLKGVYPHQQSLTHFCLVDLSILINWMSLFPILGLCSVLFHFYSISNRKSCKQTVKTLIIWVCTVCLCPKKGMLCLYGLTSSLRESGEALDDHESEFSIEGQLIPFWNDVVNTEEEEEADILADHLDATTIKIQNGDWSLQQKS